MWRNKTVYIYFLTYFFNAAVSFGGVALITHYLDAPDYGIINLYSGIIILLMPFISGGTLYPMSVAYFKNPADQFSQFFTHSQVIPVISLSFFTLICLLFQGPISSYLGVAPEWVWILPLTTWLVMLNEIIMMMARNRNQAIQFAIFSAGKNLLEISLTVLFVIGLRQGLEGRLASAAIAPAFFAIFSVYIFFRWKLIRSGIDWKQVRNILLLSLPFVFERLALFVLGNSDRYFINEYDPLQKTGVGYYGLGSQLATTINLVILSMTSAYHPYLFKRLAEGFKGAIHRSTVYFIIACAVAVGGLFIATPFVFSWFISPEYQPAQKFVYLLSTGYFMWGVYNAMLGYLLYTEKNRQIFYISLIGMIASITLNFLIVPRLGAFGAAITSIITYSIMALTCFLFVRKYFLKKATI